MVKKKLMYHAQGQQHKIKTITVVKGEYCNTQG